MLPGSPGSSDSMVVWMSFGQDGDLGGIFGQRFDQNGSPQGSEFRINTTTEGHQGSTEVAAVGTAILATAAKVAAVRTATRSPPPTLTNPCRPSARSGKAVEKALNFPAQSFPAGEIASLPLSRSVAGRRALSFLSRGGSMVRGRWNWAGPGKISALL